MVSWMSVEAESASGGLNEYITHHLHHGQIDTGLVDGKLGLFNWDSWAVSLVLGLVFLFWFWSVARRATSGVPGKMQAFVEMVVEFIDTQVKDSFHGDRRSVAPLALTIFMWVVFMNTMDLLPLDLPGWVVSMVAGEEAAHHFYMRVVPTADLNTTLGLSVTVFFILIGHALAAKGGFGFGKELLTAPFHAHHRVAGEAHFAGDATVRQHVWRRVGVHADCRPACQRCDIRSRRAVQCGVGHLPHPDHSVAGLHLHGADGGVYRRCP
jgi:F-type H+-transporting ATPase subunit a